MIEWEVFIMKEISELTVITITALTTLLIMGMVLIEFKTLDTTLLAGIIAFVGAVIGGSITLIGVNKTIENNNLSKKINDAPIKLEKIAYNIRFLKELWKNFNFLGMDIFQKPNDTYKMAEKLIRESNFIELSAGISPQLYKKTTDLENLLMGLNLKFNQQIEPYDFLEYYKDCEEIILNLIGNYEKEKNKLIEIIRED